MPKYRPIEEVCESLPNVKTGRDALLSAGMSLNAAANIMLLSHDMDIRFVILRAGNLPAYYPIRGPKRSNISSKTSIFASIPLDPLHNRIKNGAPIAHSSKDIANLALSPRDPKYIHPVTLRVGMQEIIRELQPEGALCVSDFNEISGELTLTYKPGKGTPDFTGQFVINLKKGKKEYFFHSTPLDKPEIKAPRIEGLEKISDLLYESLFDQLFEVHYTKDNLPKTKPEPYKVFANTPTTKAELLEAIQASRVIKDESRLALLQSHHLRTRADILNKLTEIEIKKIYDYCGLITTGDWDIWGFAEPHFLPEAFTTVYNTYSEADGPEQVNLLLDATRQYFFYLKRNINPESKLYNKLCSIEDPDTLFSDFAVARAGRIKPFEFFWAQMANHLDLDSDCLYGEARYFVGMQEALNVGLEAFHLNNKNYEKLALERWNISKAPMLSHDECIELENYLKKHLDNAVSKSAIQYTIPHIHQEHYLKMPLQHGPDSLCPYGYNGGPWFIIASNGHMIYGKEEKELIEILLSSDYLLQHHFHVNPHANMEDGWGRVVAREIKLGHRIDPETYAVYLSWEKTQTPTRLLTKWLWANIGATWLAGFNWLIHQFRALAQPSQYIPPDTEETLVGTAEETRGATEKDMIENAFIKSYQKHATVSRSSLTKVSMFHHRCSSDPMVSTIDVSKTQRRSNTMKL